ncbi:MAG: ATP-binding cassette domain-containing protein [Gammaproteobacteria bacterium]|nr:ATP-binding cassette domain-containing protein [Gammaproteobacteria bacterium]MCW8840390.1 ATP-binding cassette domain-containing protein [Gammaproteobacteria bacterium]MCW8928117.1 ATP-binding cassette domain-containing protein [Gammaproteobacteria bacterium]MCW8957617.1 ATP-binding cassette domain-containing protein [Gammaproteobacteria bacterium]MCW8972988.1 ATP-binding cassette domain-containing protein [Gammaproteobacteria bacterium]
MSKTTTLVEAQGVTVHFGQRMVLDHVDLAVHQGEIVTLIGPNGAGKSTLVKVMLGLQQPNHGQVKSRPGIRVGYVPQKLSIDPVLPLTVRRFLTLTHRCGEARLAESLQEVGAGHLIENQMATLSGGETQRVLLARALLREPQLLFLDEPIQGVDVTGQSELYDLISRLRDERRCGILMVSHDLHLVMARTDRVFCLDQQVCCTGHPEQRRAQGPGGGEQIIAGPLDGLAPYTHHHHQQADKNGWCGSCQEGQRDG